MGKSYTTKGMVVTTTETTGGTQITSISETGVNIRGTANFTMSDLGGTQRAFLGFDPNDGPTPAGLLRLVGSSGDGVEIESNDYLSIESTGTGDITVLTHGAWRVGHDDLGGAGRTSQGELYANRVVIGYPSGAQGGRSATVDVNATAFRLNGTSKTAIVPTSQGYRALYTNESPDVWFMDFGTFIGGSLTLDPLFQETTNKPYHLIQTLTPEVVQVWGKRRGFEHVRFEEKTEAQFEANMRFWSEQGSA